MASTKRIRFHHESQAAGFLQTGKEENVYSNNKIMADEPAAARRKRTAGECTISSISSGISIRGTHELTLQALRGISRRSSALTCDYRDSSRAE